MTLKSARRVFLLLLIVVVCLAIAVAIAAAALPSGDSTREALSNDLSPLQGQLNFKPIVPSYLPSGTVHGAHGDVRDGQLSFFMQMSDDSGGDPSAHAYVEIDESLHAPTGPQPGIDPSASFVTLAGQEVSMVTSSGPSVQVNVELSSQIRGIDVHEGVIWAAADANSTIALSEGMRQEALKVFESMIQE